ncbi:Hemolysin-type calcium-binding [Seminavis robusta]|uniref:Hemolysin-type calcium-binding n=1 Tax=Seminavis robusta TaxID=568900 RepID=A0A9N8HXK1_9STRA|nr:Hemolysin-type calcium-binding [Seminavis robusta]|eukprot:Sro3157_g344570.1 Hemolysin-type calcium-binding (167) ;mRNA; r:4591-5252
MKLSSIITGFVALMSVAQASVIQEQESNNDIGSAQVIPVGAFTLGYNPIIANSATLPWVTIEGTGDGSYDYFSFEVRAGMIASIFDIDDPTSFNSFLTLYDSSGTQLAQNNNNRPPDDGSSRRRDAYLTYTFNTAGIYTIAPSFELLMVWETHTSRYDSVGHNQPS